VTGSQWNGFIKSTITSSSSQQVGTDLNGVANNDFGRFEMHLGLKH
jgi:hypothetical protein